MSNTSAGLNNGLSASATGRPQTRLIVDLRTLVPLALIMLGSLVLLVLRMRGLFPQVFADELLYSTAARLEPMKQAVLPSYVYFALFGATNACGPAFLSCARGLNVALFVAAAPFIYLCARRFCDRAPALCITAFALFSPVNSYVFYFMPEATYFFGMWVLMWFALTRYDRPGAGYGVGLGVLFGLLSMVKAHALFIMPAQCVFMLFLGWRERALVARIIAIAAMLITFAVVREGLGYLLAGPAGLDLLGSFYGTAAKDNQQGSRIAQLLPPAFVSLKGHLLTLMLLVPLPLAALLWSAGQRSVRADHHRAATLLGATLLFAAPFGLTVMYTASIAHVENEATRLHLRYYSYALPLLLMIGAAGLDQATAQARRWPRAILAALAGAALLYAMYRLRIEYRPNYIDSPEIMAFFQRRPWMIALAQLGLLGWWVVQPQRAARWFVLALVPVLAFHLMLGMRDQVSAMGQPNVADAAGIFAREHLSPQERKGLLLAGGHLGLLMRAKFQLDAPEVQMLPLADGVEFDASQIPRDRDWLLLIGDHALPADLKVVARKEEFVMVRLENRFTPLASVDLNRPLAPGGAITSIEGLGETEDWGTWSLAKRVVIHLRDLAPVRLHLVLRGRAYGPNLGKDVTVHAGEASGHFRFDGELRDATVRLQTDGRQRDIVLEIPEPTSPQQRGESGDTRTLGIGLSQIVIGETQVVPLR